MSAQLIIHDGALPYWCREHIGKRGVTSPSPKRDEDIRANITYYWMRAQPNPTKTLLVGERSNTYHRRESQGEKP
jgi:hypothetical protein